MQQWCDDLESNLPLRPQRSEEVEYDEGFTDGAEEGGDGCEEEEPGEEEVVGWTEPVEDDGYVGEEFTDDVECACHQTQSALALNWTEKTKVGPPLYPAGKGPTHPKQCKE